MSTIDDTCRQCGFWKLSGCKSPNMKPSGSKIPDVYVLGMAPGDMEDEQNTQFVGRSGELIRPLLRKFGKKVRFYNAVNCRPPNNNVGEREIKFCSTKVIKDIKKVKPKVIICLGSIAIKSLFPNAPSFTIQTIRGHYIPLRIGGSIIPVMVTYHPSYFLRGGYRTGSPNDNNELMNIWKKDIKLSSKTMVKPGKYTPPKMKYIPCFTFNYVRECFSKLAKEPMVSFDVETIQLSPFNQGATLYTIAFSFRDGSTYAIPLDNYFPAQSLIYDALRKWLTNYPNQKKIAHSTIYDVLWIVTKCGIDLNRERLKGEYHDTQLLSWLNDERRGLTSLKRAVWIYLGYENWSSEVNIRDIRSTPLKNVLKYNAYDAFYTLQLYEVLSKKISKVDDFSKLYREMLIPSILAFTKIQWNGVVVDNVKRLEYSNDISTRSGELLNNIRSEVSQANFNPKSPLHLSSYFIDKMGYTSHKRTKTGYSMDMESLSYIVDQYDDNVAKLILQFRELEKLRTTYIEGIEKDIGIDNCFHSSFNLTATVTGRTSSERPNLQNFPKRKNKEIRSIVTCPPGYKLVSFDYGQIEARLFGVLTGDPVFCEYLDRGYDIHLDNAITLFGKDNANSKRGVVKGATFGLLYGASVSTISDMLGVSRNEVSLIKSLIFNRFTTFLEWQKTIVENTYRDGYLTSLFGRRRRLPLSYPEILNYITQSSASDMGLYSVSLLGNLYRIAFFIHDDISFYLKEDTLQQDIDVISSVMLNVPYVYMSTSPLFKRWVPLEIECAVGDNWGNLKFYKKNSHLDSNFSKFECLELGKELIKTCGRYS